MLTIPLVQGQAKVILWNTLSSDVQDSLSLDWCSHFNADWKASSDAWQSKQQEPNGKMSDPEPCLKLHFQYFWADFGKPVLALAEPRRAIVH